MKNKPLRITLKPSGARREKLETLCQLRDYKPHEVLREGLDLVLEKNKELILRAKK